MRYNQAKIEELVESYINGNISFVRGKVKRLSKLEFYQLVRGIVESGGNQDEDRVLWQITRD